MLKLVCLIISFLLHVTSPDVAERKISMELLTYVIEERGNKPVYIYLYECIKKDIMAGILLSGEKLPSKRSLASHLGIAVITVENAYAQLETEGYIIGIEKKGYFVAEDIEELVEGYSIISNNPQNGIENKEAKNCEEQNRKINGEKNTRSQLLADFSVNRMQVDSFPFDSWAKLMRRSMLDHESSFLQAPDGRGVLELRKAIAEYLYTSKGMHVSPERIIIGPGTEYLHHILIQLVGRSNMVAVEDPGYKKVGRIYETNGVRVLHIPVDEKGMIIDRLKDNNVKLVHISPSHHFPTGSVMPAHRRGRLLNWAREQRAYVIEDDYDSEFRFEGRPLSTLYAMDSNYVIYMNTFTKILAPSIRIAYMILPDSLYEKYCEKLYFYSSTVSVFEQFTLAAFIDEGYYARHIRRARNRYKKCRTEMLNAMSESGLLEYVSIYEDQAGLQLVFELKEDYHGGRESFAEALLNKGVKITPITDYCYQNTGDFNRKFLLCYSEMEYEVMMKAFAIIIEKLRTISNEKCI